MTTDAATPETPVNPEPGGVDADAPAVGENSSARSAPDQTASGAPASDEPARTATTAGTDKAGTDEAGTDEAGTDEAGTATRPATGSTAGAPAGRGPVPEDAGGRLTARLREARARLEPEQTIIPAPRTPEGVVPPAPFSSGRGAVPADVLRAVDDLAAQLADLEQGGDEQPPERRALMRALDRSAGGVPDAGWSAEDRVETEALTGAAELAGTLHQAGVAVVARLDAEERPGSAVEVDAVVTALQVARMVLDLEAFDRRVH